MKRWIPFCCAVAFVILGLVAISALAYVSYASFDAEATGNTAIAGREPGALRWLERYASRPIGDVARANDRFVDVHFADRWIEDRWDDDPDPDAAAGTTYAIDGEYAHVAYDRTRHVVVSRFYDTYKTPDGTSVRFAPPPPMPIPQTDARAMRSVRGLAVGEGSTVFARAGYPAPHEHALYHLPGPCRKSNPCAVLLYARTAANRIAALYFFRAYYYGSRPAPSPPIAQE